ncbi:uncharacterized protein LOC123212443 [Mangifera indica]|uniref:uncharacterized protein LOC123212443 n=1 Tax=Mangifera indica TaxID=29780 RepID=UPI001CF98E18|nr:uncharacterized protein LOC123212443 [Mangifera indica]
MGLSHRTSPRLSLNRSTGRVRVVSPSLQRKRASNSIETDQKVEFLGNGEEIDYGGSYEEKNGWTGNKVMVVVDSSLDAKGALEWALSHTIQNQDTILLLYVNNVKSSKQGKESPGKINLRAYEKLYSMKNTCQMKRPGVEVELIVLEGKEKGPIIVEEAKKQKVSLLVLGQRKKWRVWRLIKKWASKSAMGGIVDYCIQNASCMTIAVRRKSNKLGGYLITTKRHKNFWLLA